VAHLIGIDAPTEIRRLNVSTRHARPDEASPALRERIAELNQYDIRLYSQMVERKKNKAHAIPSALAPKRALGWGWSKYDPKEMLLTRPIGSLSVVSPVPSPTINEQTILRVNIRNRSNQNWLESGHFPIRASYHWLRPSGETYLFDGLRTPLPKGPLLAGASVTVDMAIVAPSEPGVYTLVLSLVQERFSWLELRGFEPAILQVVVRDAEGVA
jgi:hypothetical protein